MSDESGGGFPFLLSQWSEWVRNVHFVVSLLSRFIRWVWRAIQPPPRASLEQLKDGLRHKTGAQAMVWLRESGLIGAEVAIEDATLIDSYRVGILRYMLVYVRVPDPERGWSAVRFFCEFPPWGCSAADLDALDWRSQVQIKGTIKRARRLGGDPLFLTDCRFLGATPYEP